MKTSFIETAQFNQMISYKPYAETKNEKKKVKFALLDSIKEAIGDKWTRLKEGTRQAFDMACFLSSELGFYYAGSEYMAGKHDISERTLRYRLSELVELGQVIKVHRRAKKCNGRGKPIYLFTQHPYFTYWVELLGLDLSSCHTNCHTENTESPTESKVDEGKKVPTYSLPSKQESNNIENPIMKAVFNRVQDAIKEGSTITYLSSYVDRVFRSLEQKALYAENNRQKALRKKREDEAKRFLNPIKDVPLVNWLEM
ncbi:hypothetical protein MZM54_33150 [[Brevibacterium] frigoritolerans]|nr:hypothetical protein [Peribacillus frigoritolerans]